MPNHHASKGRSLYRLFDEYRWDKMTRRGASVGLASEEYALYPLLRHYVNVVVGVGGALKLSVQPLCLVSNSSHFEKW